MFPFLLIAAYVAVAACVLVVLMKKRLDWYVAGAFSARGPFSNVQVAVSLAACWPIHLWSWFSEFRKELF